MHKEILHNINLSRRSVSKNIIQESKIPTDLKYFYNNLKLTTRYILDSVHSNEFDLYDKPAIQKAIKNELNNLISAMCKIKSNYMTLAEYTYSYVLGIKMGQFLNDKLSIDIDSMMHGMFHTKYHIFILPCCKIKVIDLWNCLSEEKKLKLCEYLNKLYIHGKIYIRKCKIQNKIKSDIKNKKKIIWKILFDEKKMDIDKFDEYINSIKLTPLRQYCIDLCNNINSHPYYYCIQDVQVGRLEYETNINAQKDTINAYINTVLDKSEDLANDIEHKKNVICASDKVVDTVIDSCINNNIKNLRNIDSNAHAAKDIIESTTEGLKTKLEKNELKKSELVSCCISLLDQVAPDRSISTMSESGPKREAKIGLRDMINGLQQHMKCSKMDIHSKRLIKQLQKKFC